MLINLSGIYFLNFRVIMFWSLSPNFYLWGKFYPQKWAYFDNFQLKCLILAKFTPVMTFLNKIYVNKPGWNNVFKFLENKFFDLVPQILSYDVILAQEMTQFLPFSKKTYFNKVVPVMTFLTKVMLINLNEIIFPNI